MQYSKIKISYFHDFCRDFQKFARYFLIPIIKYTSFALKSFKIQNVYHKRNNKTCQVKKIYNIKEILAYGYVLNLCSEWTRNVYKISTLFDTSKWRKKKIFASKCCQHLPYMCYFYVSKPTRHHESFSFQNEQEKRSKERKTWK